MSRKRKTSILGDNSKEGWGRPRYPMRPLLPLSGPTKAESGKLNSVRVGVVVSNPGGAGHQGA